VPLQHLNSSITIISTCYNNNNIQTLAEEIVAVMFGGFEGDSHRLQNARVYISVPQFASYLGVSDCSPSGWDSEKKISILYEGLNSMRHDDVYNDVITRPVTRKVSRVPFVVL